jgi:hypothetical protein
MHITSSSLIFAWIEAPSSPAERTSRQNEEDNITSARRGLWSLHIQNSFYLSSFAEKVYFPSLTFYGQARSYRKYKDIKGLHVTALMINVPPRTLILHKLCMIISYKGGASQDYF